MPSVTCPTCLTVLRTSEGWCSSEPVLCPNCDRRIWVGHDVRGADRPEPTYWDQVSIDEVLAEVASAPPLAHVADPPAADSPDPAAADSPDPPAPHPPA